MSVFCGHFAIMSTLASGIWRKRTLLLTNGTEVVIWPTYLRCFGVWLKTLTEQGCHVGLLPMFVLNTDSITSLPCGIGCSQLRELLSRGNVRIWGGGDYCRFADKMGWNIDILAAVMKRMHTTRLGSSGLKHSRSYWETTHCILFVEATVYILSVLSRKPIVNDPVWHFVTHTFTTI